MEKLIEKFENYIVDCRNNHTDFASQYCAEEARKIAIEFAVRFHAENTKVETEGTDPVRLINPLFPTIVYNRANKSFEKFINEYYARD